MAWVDFVICLLFGMLGVHKFREKKIGMGVLYLFTFGLFGIGWIVDSIRYLLAAVRGERIEPQVSPPTSPKATPPARNLPADAPLPEAVPGDILLHRGEICHYRNHASLVKIKNRVVGYTGGSQGVSVRIAKGLTYRVGSSKASPIRKDVRETIPGILGITSQRVIFSASQGAFDKKISTLSAITPSSDRITLQFGTQNYSLLTQEANYIFQILSRVVSNGAERPPSKTGHA